MQLKQIFEQFLAERFPEIEFENIRKAYREEYISSLERIKENAKEAHHFSLFLSGGGRRFDVLADDYQDLAKKLPPGELLLWWNDSRDLTSPTSLDSIEKIIKGLISLYD